MGPSPVGVEGDGGRLGGTAASTSASAGGPGQLGLALSLDASLVLFHAMIPPQNPVYIEIMNIGARLTVKVPTCWAEAAPKKEREARARVLYCMMTAVQGMIVMLRFSVGRKRSALYFSRQYR